MDSKKSKTHLMHKMVKKHTKISFKKFKILTFLLLVFNIIHIFIEK